MERAERPIGSLLSYHMRVLRVAGLFDRLIGSLR